MVAVVPARNEADVIAQSIGSLLRQDYPGPFRVVLVDDGSERRHGRRGARADAGERGERLRRLARRGAAGRMDRQAVGPAAGRRARHGRRATPDYFLLTDADIGHAPDNLRALVARAERDGCVLVSLMAELSCTTLGGAVPHSRLRLLLPDALSVRLGRASATRDSPRPPAAACWCGARRWSGPAASPSIRSEIIDDCALALGDVDLGEHARPPGEGTSESTLSVETSKSTSSSAMVSPTCLNHLVMVPSVADHRVGAAGSQPWGTPPDAGRGQATTLGVM